jgi:hypothetical protein
VDLRRLLLRGLVLSLTATALIAIAVLLFAEFDERTWKIVGTTALLSGFSLLGMPGGALLDQGRAVWLGWLTLALAGYALAHALVLMWAESNGGWKVLVTAVAFAGVCSQASATTSRRRATDPPTVRVLYVVAIVGAVVTATMASLAAWLEIEDEAFYYRLLAAVAVAVLLTTILQPILRRAGREAAVGAAFELRLTTEDGTEVARSVEAPDFAAAVERAIRELERDGVRIVRVERR